MTIMYRDKLPLTLSMLLVVNLLSSCASEKATLANDGYTISNIDVLINGATSKARPNMADICKGFILSRQQVQDFFVYARHVKDTRSDQSDTILPCYVSGTAIINKYPYHWIIRSGGIGEFYDKNKRFLKICGKGCCDKIAGMC